MEGNGDDINDDAQMRRGIRRLNHGQTVQTDRRKPHRSEGRTERLTSNHTYALSRIPEEETPRREMSHLTDRQTDRQTDRIKPHRSVGWLAQMRISTGPMTQFFSETVSGRTEPFFGNISGNMVHLCLG